MKCFQPLEREGGQLSILSEKDVPLSFGPNSSLETTDSEAPSQERLLAAHQMVVHLGRVRELLGGTERDEGF